MINKNTRWPIGDTFDQLFDLNENERRWAVCCWWKASWNLTSCKIHTFRLNVLLMGRMT